MNKQYFYTIMEGDEFLSSHLMGGMTCDISEAIRLDNEQDAVQHFRGLNKDRNFKIMEVECILREYEI